MRRLILNAAAVLFCVTLANASSADTTAPTVTMAVNQASDNSLLIIAVRKGFLEKEGLSGRIQLFEDGAASLRAVVAGQADVGINTAVPQLAARARGGKIVQVMTAYLSGRINGTVVMSSIIAKPADFAGKTIAVARGSGAHYHEAWFIDRYNLQNKVNVVFLDAADQIPALARGDIQGMWTWEPFLSKAVETVPGAKILGRTIDDGLQFPGTVAIREELATKQPEVAVKIVRALIATIDWMNANPLEAGKVANEVMRAPSDEMAAQAIKTVDWVGDLKTSEVKQEVEMAKWGIRAGLFPAPDAKKLVDELIYPSIMKQAAPTRIDF